MWRLQGFVILAALLFSTPFRANTLHGIPPGSLSIDFGPGHGATLPLQDFLDHLIVLMTVNGHPGLKFAIDTGSANSMIDRATAVKIGLPLSDRYQPAGGVGSQLLLLPLSQPVDAAMGGITLAGLRFAEMDFSSWDDRLGLHLDGTIGNDVLQDCVVHIDYVRQSLDLMDPATFHPPGRDATVLPLAFLSVPSVDAEIGDGRNASIPVNLMVDTGGVHALSLPYFFLRNHPDLQIAQGGSFTRVDGVGGIIEESIYKLGDLNLGGIVIAHPSAIIPNHIKGSPGVATMGEEILQRFDVTIDIPGRNLYLKPNANYGDPFLYVDSGLDLCATGPGLRTFVVHRVTPDTMSDHAGFKAGDVLMVIDDTSLNGLSMNGVRRLLHALKPYKITVNRGGKLITLDFIRNNGSASK